MKSVFRETLGQFGLAGALIFSLAAAYAVLDLGAPDKRGSTFNTVGSQLAACENRGVDTPMGRLGCDRRNHSSTGAGRITVRKVETTSFGFGRD